MPSGLVTDVDQIRVWLDWPPDEAYRLEALAAAPPTNFELPEPDEARILLRNMDVPPPAIDEMVPAMPSPASDPEAWWLLERCYAAFRGGVRPPWPAPWVTDEPLTRYFHLYVFLGALRDVLDKHAARGIPERATYATLGDVGLQVAHYHARNGGVYGFDGAFWIFNHFRGDLFQIGRLQYELGVAAY